MGAGKFNEYRSDFPDRWNEAVKAIRDYKNISRGRAGDIDIIVTRKEKVPFELCVELK